MPHLQQIGTFVPEESVSIAELSDYLGLSSAQVRVHTKFFGQDKVAVAGDRDLTRMLVPAGEQALAGADRDSVRYLVYAHTIQYVAPVGHRVLDQVRAELGLRNATVFALSQQHCASPLYALSVAEHLLAQEGPDATVLVMTGEKAISPHFRLIPGTTVMGDATAACLLGTGPDGDEVLSTAVRTLGRFYQCNDASEEVLADYVKVYNETVIGTMHDALAGIGLDFSDVDLVLPHNVNTFSWRKISAGCGIPLDRIYLDNVATLGHCFGADPFINLASARVAGKLRPGNIVLLVAAGLGATFATVVARIGEGFSS
ncbi:ketoacyl-ACP synthase III family protein [Actinophytocola oryzae]|uniref:3-oxoacyl-[acyl-carrier-protein] synthase-3 n=1 Tax=Actinophytocola oryzae TaxID=502181 RepID=A0A4R7VXQ7_9PSEU|nr:ketoacyl-ACP synthase III family protein [Actinophytocola oryzae]TDV54824.1 3-oxoacyl-[acyl-carrier-protein] synthase-3 [Actinophytocola oryzae]